MPPPVNGASMRLPTATNSSVRPPDHPSQKRVSLGDSPGDYLRIDRLCLTKYSGSLAGRHSQPTRPRFLILEAVVEASKTSVHRVLFRVSAAHGV